MCSPFSSTVGFSLLSFAAFSSGLSSYIRFLGTSNGMKLDFRTDLLLTLAVTGDYMFSCGRFYAASWTFLTNS